VFDQSAQYVVQLAPVEMEDHFFVGVEVKQMEISEQEAAMPQVSEAQGGG